MSDAPHRRGIGVGARLRSAVAASAVGSAGAHRAPCSTPRCRGVRSIERVPFSGELRETCGTCGFRGTVQRQYPRATEAETAQAFVTAAAIPAAGEYGTLVCPCGEEKRINALRCSSCATTTRQQRTLARQRARREAPR